MYSKNTFSKKKLFIFHNKKVVTHIEQQPNQSSYIESLILSNIENPITQPNIHNLLQEIKQQLLTNTPHKKIEIEPDNSNISDSISNILNI